MPGIVGPARHLLLVPVVAVLATTAAACATSDGVARPAPFPGPIAGPSARSASVGPSITSSRLPLTTAVDTALSLRGVPYRLGGTRPETGFDCSGFVRYVFEPVLTLPRTVAEQSRVGRPVRAEDLVAGDLVFFSTIGPGPSHVGIALDGRTFVHAPVSGGVVRVDRLDAPYWRTRYLGARRLG